MIGVGTLSKGTFSKTLVERARKKSRFKRVLTAGLMLTPMVDMFSLLVIFLLQTFSASPEMLAVAKGVSLPSAISGSEFKDAPVLALAQDGVYLDQKKIGDSQEISQDPSALMEGLADLRERWQKSHPNQEFPGRITLQADKETPSELVSRFMAMLPSQAYGSVQLAVMSVGGAPVVTPGEGSAK